MVVLVSELGKIILGNRGYGEQTRSIIVCCGKQELCGVRERLSVDEDDARLAWLGELWIPF